MFSFFHFYLCVRCQLKSIENENIKSTTSHFVTPRTRGKNIKAFDMKVFLEGFVYIFIYN